MIRHLIVVLLFLAAPLVATGAQTVCDGTKVFTEKVCPGDNLSPDEKALYDLVIKYRATKGLAAPKLSTPLSLLANRHLIDIKSNLKSFTHSWSNCPYDIKDDKTWHCISDAPKRLKTGYNGTGYETLYVTAETKANINLALDKWKGSTLHNSIITNQGMFKDRPWDEIGVSVDGNYAALWFGTPAKAASIGVSYDQVIAGLTQIVALKQETAAGTATKWQGSSADKKIRMEIAGTKSDISEAKMAVTAKLEADGQLSSQNYLVLSTLLKNVFPAWTDRDIWLQTSLKMIGANNSAERTKVIGKNLVEAKYGSGGAIVLQIVPQTAKRAIEIN